MNKRPRISSWERLTIGVVMLGVAVLGSTVLLCSRVGIGKAVGAIVLAVAIAAWLIVGIVLVVESISALRRRP